MNPRCDPRSALQVTRYHTWPRLREQSVGEHSAQVQRILLAIWPDVPRHLLIHCLIHDIGEAVSGDPPFPVKRDNPVLKAECDRIERLAHLEMCLPWALPSPITLTKEEAAIFKIAEFIEMFEWGMYELALGNQYGKTVATRCIVAACKLLPNVSSWMVLRIETYIRRREKEHESYEFYSACREQRYQNVGAQREDLQGQLEETGRGSSVPSDGAQVG